MLAAPPHIIKQCQALQYRSPQQTGLHLFSRPPAHVGVKCSLSPETGRRHTPAWTAATRRPAPAVRSGQAVVKLDTRNQRMFPLSQLCLGSESRYSFQTSSAGA
ncbi:hypothetical protein RRG08_038287 [Elysia crispata]|uniref:Uncharacterized protein n=1 Tax=Elysia crispata TaxID=231223 RepID=A0AAE1AP95_9GAST|nr:hypothetical protein RRG08_038287 [Elysia crispata]